MTLMDILLRKLPSTGRHTVILMVLTLASACTAQSTLNIPASTSISTPIPLTLDDAQRTASDFLNAWLQDNYNAMYGLVTINSRDAFPFQEFAGLYKDAESTLGLVPGGKSYVLTSALQQGNTADIAYDETFDTRLFGKFTDSARILQLVSVPEGWRVAWSPGSIFAEMKNGAVLYVVQTGLTRGNIYDREGAVIADMNGVAIRIKLLTKAYPGGNPDNCFNELARVLKNRSAQQMKQAYGKRTGWDFAFDIGELSEETFLAEEPALERVCSLSYKRIPARRYVAGGLAPHVVGYVGRIPAETFNDWTARGYSADALVGIDGIEHYWEDTLAGRGAASLVLRSPSGTIHTLAKREAKPSQSVYLTLNRELQAAVQGMLKDAFANASWGGLSTGAAAVVMDVHSGEILAMASYPDFNVDAFNPNTTLKDAQSLINVWAKDPKKPTFDRAALGQYPPGSVFT